MNALGLTDSMASVVAEPAACPACGSSALLVDGPCVGCLLHQGLTADRPQVGESLEALLARVDIRDTDWSIGSYDILEEIGRGGMGVIYKARQRHSRRIVALKRVLAYHADCTETVVRFRREAEAAASLDHPNVLPIYEVGDAEGLPFFTMKFAPGGSLHQAKHVLRENPRHCVWLMARIARAVHYAHSQGILHRDLKPGNILLDGWREPMVSDFGLAKWLDANSDLTRTLTIFGTPGYIAPEQASGPSAAVGPAADVYSLGAILFDLLAGRPPFLGEHALAVMRQAADGPAPKLRSLLPTSDRDLETICAKCLEREPQARYDTARALADDLECWLQGRDIVARPVRGVTRAWRWSKRNPLLTAATAACVVLGALGATEWVTSARLAEAIENSEARQRSLLVLPVEDLDEQSTSSASGRELTSQLVSAVKQTSGLHLRSYDRAPESQSAPRGADDWQTAANAAGARWALRATVRKRQHTWRLVVHLGDSTSGRLLKTWLKEDIAPAEVAAAVREQIGDATTERNVGTTQQQSVAPLAGSSDSQAVSYYEQGKELFFRYNLPDQLRAIDSFREAVKRDREYAEAHAMLSWACQLRASTDADPRWLEEAERSASVALRLAPLLPEAHRARAGYLQRLGKLRACLDPYLTAYELDPTNPRGAATVGNVYQQLGRPDMAIRWLRKAAAREPRPVYADNLGNAWTALGEYDEAESAYRAASIFRPDLPVGPLGLARLALLRGDYAEARRRCEDARVKYPRDPQPLVMAALVEFFGRNTREARELYELALANDRTGGVNFAGAVRFLSAVGWLKLMSSDTGAGAQALLEQARELDEKEVAITPDNPNRLYSLASTLAAMQQKEAALDVLQRAVGAGWIDYRSLEADPRFDGVRHTDAFKRSVTTIKNEVQKMRRQAAKP